MPIFESFLSSKYSLVKVERPGKSSTNLYNELIESLTRYNLGEIITGLIIKVIENILEKHPELKLLINTEDVELVVGTIVDTAEMSIDYVRYNWNWKKCFPCCTKSGED